MRNLFSEEIARQLDDSKTKVVVTSEKNLGKVIEAVKQVKSVTVSGRYFSL